MSPRNKFYGLAVLGSSFLWCSVLFVHWQAQKRASRRVQDKIAELSAAVKEMQNRPAVVDSAASSEISSEPARSTVASSLKPGLPFRILGTGRLGPNYTYLDVRHCDGSRRRYYCRNEDGTAGVQRMMAIVDADSIDAEYGLLWASDESAFASMPYADSTGFAAGME